ncbi:tetratricopeptide repeat protein [Spirosoma jeollabukense]
MRLTEEQYELIEAYLKNELSPTDRTSFEVDIRADEALQMEVDRQRDIRMGLQALGIQRALQRAKTQYEASLPTATSATPKLTVVRSVSSWRYWAAAASVVVVLGIGYYAYQQTESRQTDLAYTETAISGTNDELIKSFPSEHIAPETRTQFLAAFKNYEAGKYDQVIEQLKTLPDDKQTIHYKDYFLGLSYLANKQPNQAIPLLIEAQETPLPELRQKVEWFLALAYVKNNQKRLAFPILKRISTEKANPFKALAQKVLNRIH